MTDTTVNDPNLNPANTPGALKPIGVKRVNNWPLIIMGIGLGVFLLIIMLVAADRAEQQEARNNAPAEQRVARDASALAEEMTRGYESGYIPAAEGTPAESPLPELLEQEAAEKAPKPQTELSPEVAAIIDSKPGNALPKQNLPTADSEAEQELRRRIEQARLRKLEDAITARTGITMQSTSSGGGSGLALANRGASGGNDRNSQLAQLAEVQRQLQSTTAMLTSQGDPMQVYQARLASIQGSGLANTAGGGSGAPALANLSTGSSRPAGSSASGYNQFEGSADRWTLNSTVDAPQTPFVLRAGFVLPGIMISGVNSDLPGQLMAQVSQDVYDTATGNHLLIPQGSRLVGQYASSVAYGQERVMVAWQRIVFPDGKAMDIGAMQGADGSGYSGFKDQVNHHFWRIFGSAFLMSVVTAGVEMSQDNGNQDLTQSRRAGDALSEALGQQLGQATAQMIMRNLNIAPTIEIRPGYRFNVMVSKDMVFTKPYQSFDY